MPYSDHDWMIKTVYDRMVAASSIPQDDPQFYEKLEMFAQWTFDQSYDKNELHKAIERLKMSAQQASAESDNLRLQEIPPHLKKRILSSTDCVQKIIEKKISKGIKIDEQILAMAYSDCSESRESALAERLDRLQPRIENNPD